MKYRNQGALHSRKPESVEKVKEGPKITIIGAINRLGLGIATAAFSLRLTLTGDIHSAFTPPNKKYTVGKNLPTTTTTIQSNL